jgi:hypothetical protein
MSHIFLRQSVIAASVAAAFPGIAFSQSVAKADFTIGNPTVAGVDGRSRPLVRGGEVRVGELVSTGTGRVQLRFADGAQMALQPNTDFKVEEFRFTEKGAGGDNVVMNLLKGGMRTITGAIGRSNRANYALKTPTATIGIRGTEFTAEFRDALRAFCVQGLIFLANGGGNLLLASGQGAFVSTFTTPPQRDDTKPSLPTISKQEMEVLLQVAGVDPKNPQQDFNPVVTLQTALAQLGNVTHTGSPSVDPKLIGEFTGNWAVTKTLTSSASSFANGVVTLDSEGKLSQFSDSSATTTASLGTASPSSLGNDGIIAWGSWLSGVTAGNNPLFSGADLSSSGPLHYVVGLPVSSMPTSGVGTYNMLGSSAACRGGGCTSAAVNSSSFNVDFGTLSVGFAMSLTINGAGSGTYVFSPFCGGSLSSNGTFALNGTLSGPGSSFCNSFQAAGFLSGSGAVRAGVAWNGQVVNGGSTFVSGATAYTKQQLQQ